MGQRYMQLNETQRKVLANMHRDGKTQSDIAKAIGVSQSTISRELKRNASEKSGKYYYTAAHTYAMERREWTVNNKAFPLRVRNKVFALIKEHWSPEQISGRLAIEGLSISFETIYAWIRADKANGGNLYTFCRHKLRKRKWTPLSKASAKNIPNRVSIHERPKEADGSRFGDFEMDLIVGPMGKGAILTLTDRATNFVFLRKLPNCRKSLDVANEVCKALFPIKCLLKTITSDNGSEFAAHHIITKTLNVPVFFADPYASWQKGAIENANKLIRQYIPKHQSLSDVSSEKLDIIQKLINKRPRKKLLFKSPLEALAKYLS